MFLIFYLFFSSGGSSDTWFRHPLQALYHVDSSSASCISCILVQDFHVFHVRILKTLTRVVETWSDSRIEAASFGRTWRHTKSKRCLLFFQLFFNFSQIWKFKNSDLFTSCHFLQFFTLSIWGRDLPDALQRWADENLDVRRGRWPGSEQGFSKHFEIGKTAKPWKIEGRSIQSNLRTS